MTYARRKDATQQTITNVLELDGLAVFDVSMVPGLGFDIVVFDPAEQRWLVFELKSDASTRRRASDDTLTTAQLRARARAPILCAMSAVDVLRCFRGGL